MNTITGYTVIVSINKVGKNGKSSNENFEYIFIDKGISLFEKRKQAIQKAKNLISFFKGEPKFSLFSESEKKRFKNFNTSLQ